MAFKIDFLNYFKCIPTLTTELIGHFSIDGDMQYRADLSQLKYYIPPSDPNNVNFDLNANVMSTRHKPTSHIKLDNILRWISDNYYRLEKPLSTQGERWLDIDFISKSGVIRTMLSSLYTQKKWIICASKYRGTIYLCEFYTDERERRHVNATMSEKQINSRGLKFEQYMVADHPSHKPDPSRILNECEEFHCMFKAKFGNHSLLYGAEIDGISSQQPITDTLVGKTVELIELKTIGMFNEEGNLHGEVFCEIVSKWWSQNYLKRINKIICGLKDKTSTVRMIKEYPTHNLPQLSKTFCHMDKCKMFCKIFLDNIKSIVTKDHDECMYKFYSKPSAADIINYSEEVPDNEMYFFLKRWFVDKIEEYRTLSIEKHHTDDTVEMS